MREIKFRAWDKQNPRMYYIGDDTAHGSSFLLNFNGDVLDAKHEEGINYRIVWARIGHQIVLMQYTGLKDKNGKEIYEGDIVRHTIKDHEWSGNHEVIFHDGCFMIRGGNPKGLRNGKAFNHYPHNLEIIGNIYENPELVEGRAE